MIIPLCWALATPLSVAGSEAYVFIPHNSNIMLTAGSAGPHTLTQYSRGYQSSTGMVLHKK
ncbi:MAG: hypothetical protein ACOCW5_04730 [Spirochaetia bacterium]